MKKHFALLIFFQVFITQFSHAQQTYVWNVQSGDWGTSTNWTPNGVPGALDSVVFTVFGSSATSCTISSNQSCRSIFYTTSNKDFTVTITGTNSLTVTNLITFSEVTANGFQLMAIGTGTMTCGGIVMSAQGNNNRQNRITFSSGTFQVNGNIVLNGTNNIQNEIIFTGNGTFSLGGNVVGTPTIQTGTSAVNYVGTGNQTIPGGSYETYSVGGSGVKTLSGTLIINGSGKLMKKGSATLSGTVQYSSGATLEYNDTATGFSTSTGAEWPATNGPTNVIVNLSGSGTPLVNLGTSKTLSGQLTLTSGVLAIGANTLTLNGTISGTGGDIRGGSTSNLTIGGSGTFGTLNMDQSTRGTTNVINTLTINRSTSGTVSLGDSMNIAGVVIPTLGTLTTGGFLKLLATSSTSYAQIAPGGGSISGNITMQMGSSNVNPGWRPIAIPLTTTIGTLTGISTLFNSHGVANERNVYYWDATQNGATGNNKGWTAAASTDNSSRAYLIYANNSNGLHTFTGTLNATGTNKTGNQVFSLENFVDPANIGSDARGWNFIPNPYPSNLNITNLLGSGTFTPAYKSIHVYNYTTDQYEVYSNSGVSIVNYHNSGVAGTIKNISPFVGFWVKANGTQTLTVTDNDRTTSMTNVATLLKKPYDLIRLNMVNAEGKRDQCVVYLKDDATFGFDNEGDAYKLDGMNGAPALSTLIGNTRAAINALPAGELAYSIPVSFKSTTIGNVKFMLDISEMDPSWTIELEDKLTGKRHNFRNGDYTFDASANSDLRFVIHLSKSGATSLLPEESASSFRLFQDHETVKIDAGFVGDPIQISVYNMEGKLVASQTMERTGIQDISLPEATAPGMYVVSAQSSTENYWLKTIK